MTYPSHSPARRIGFICNKTWGGQHQPLPHLLPLLLATRQEGQRASQPVPAPSSAARMYFMAFGFVIVERIRALEGTENHLN
jgi:hypothetical protein